MEPFMKENRVSLLTIPRADLVGSSSSPQSTTSTTTTSTRSSDGDAALLLQLPPGWKPSDLKGVRFVANAEQQQAALVVESKNCSFSCFTVETSNAFIMVPPPPPPQDDDDDDDTGTNFTSNKRCKVRGDGRTLATVPARLLKAGGSGASFLELRARALRRADLPAALRDCVWDPYAAAAAAAAADSHNTNPQQQEIKGRTLEELAAVLQVSTAQITKGLAQIPNALRLARRSPGGADQQQQQQQQYCYVLISEEPLQECYSAIVAALTEVDEFQDYAGVDGIAVSTMIEEALYRMSDEESFADADRVIQHCLRQLSKSSGRSRSSPSTIDAGDDKNARIRLDVGRIALCVAHRLFQKESSSSSSGWIDETAFFDAWQSELPGVGPLYQVHPDMLLGFAVAVEKDDDAVNNGNDETAEGQQRQWKYLPADKLPMDPKACFDELFAVKDRWLLRELEPYLQRLTDDATAAELLLRFTKIETEEHGGLSIKVYLKK